MNTVPTPTSPEIFGAPMDAVLDRIMEAPNVSDLTRSTVDQAVAALHRQAYTAGRCGPLTVDPAAIVGMEPSEPGTYTPTPRVEPLAIDAYAFAPGVAYVRDGLPYESPAGTTASNPHEFEVKTEGCLGLALAEAGMGDPKLTRVYARVPGLTNTQCPDRVALALDLPNPSYADRHDVKLFGLDVWRRRAVVSQVAAWGAERGLIIAEAGDPGRTAQQGLYEGTAVVDFLLVDEEFARQATGDRLGGTVYLRGILSPQGQPRAEYVSEFNPLGEAKETALAVKLAPRTLDDAARLLGLSGYYESGAWASDGGMLVVIPDGYAGPARKPSVVRIGRVNDEKFTSYNKGTRRPAESAWLLDAVELFEDKVEHLAETDIETSEEVLRQYQLAAIVLYQAATWANDTGFPVHLVTGDVEKLPQQGSGLPTPSTAVGLLVHPAEVEVVCLDVIGIDWNNRKSAPPLPEGDLLGVDPDLQKQVLKAREVYGTAPTQRGLSQLTQTVDTANQDVLDEHLKYELDRVGDLLASPEGVFSLVGDGALAAYRDRPEEGEESYDEEDIVEAKREADLLNVLARTNLIHLTDAGAKAALEGVPFMDVLDSNGRPKACWGTIKPAKKRLSKVISARITRLIKGAGLEFVRVMNWTAKPDDLLRHWDAGIPATPEHAAKELAADDDGDSMAVLAGVLELPVYFDGRVVDHKRMGVLVQCRVPLTEQYQVSIFTPPEGTFHCPYSPRTGRQARTLQTLARAANAGLHLSEVDRVLKPEYTDRPGFACVRAVAPGLVRVMPEGESAKTQTEPLEGTISVETCENRAQVRVTLNKVGQITRAHERVFALYHEANGRALSIPGYVDPETGEPLPDASGVIQPTEVWAAHARAYRELLQVGPPALEAQVALRKKEGRALPGPDAWLGMADPFGFVERAQISETVSLGFHSLRAEALTDADLHEYDEDVTVERLARTLIPHEPHVRDLPQEQADKRITGPREMAADMRRKHAANKLSGWGPEALRIRRAARPLARIAVRWRGIPTGSQQALRSLVDKVAVDLGCGRSVGDIFAHVAEDPALKTDRTLAMEMAKAAKTWRTTWADEMKAASQQAADMYGMPETDQDRVRRATEAHLTEVSRGLRSLLGAAGDRAAQHSDLSIRLGALAVLSGSHAKAEARAADLAERGLDEEAAAALEGVSEAPFLALIDGHVRTVCPRDVNPPKTGSKHVALYTTGPAIGPRFARARITRLARYSPTLGEKTPPDFEATLERLGDGPPVRECVHLWCRDEDPMPDLEVGHEITLETGLRLTGSVTSPNVIHVALK